MNDLFAGLAVLFEAGLIVAFVASVVGAKGGR
jgi:hypothetical protein